MRALFDVNALLAMFDGGHVHHEAISTWWRGVREYGWASCPLTQNGFLRIISGPRYPGSKPLSDAVGLLRAQAEIPGHEFWADDLTILDDAVFPHGHLLGPNQITDVYLLALAVRRGGRLVTFDRSIAAAAVRGSEPRHIVIL